MMTAEYVLSTNRWECNGLPGGCLAQLQDGELVLTSRTSQSVLIKCSSPIVAICSPISIYLKPRHVLSVGAILYPSGSKTLRELDYRAGMMLIGPWRVSCTTDLM